MLKNLLDSDLKLPSFDIGDLVENSDYPGSMGLVVEKGSLGLMYKINWCVEEGEKELTHTHMVNILRLVASSVEC